MLLRHEIDDLSDMVETSSTLYDDFGEYNKSKNDMRWNFYKGGFLNSAIMLTHLTISKSVFKVNSSHI